MQNHFIKRHLLAALGAAAMFTFTVPAATHAISNPQTVQAASYKSYTYQAKRLSKLYTVKFNTKGTNVKSIKAPSKNKTKYITKNKKIKAYWSTTYKKHKYFYLGGTVAVRANNFKRISKKAAPTLKSLQKSLNVTKSTKKAIKTSKTASTSLIVGKTNQESVYWIYDAKNKKFNQAASNLPVDTKIDLLFSNDDILSNGQTNVKSYMALYNKQLIIIPADNVAANGTVLTQAQYQAAQKK